MSTKTASKSSTNDSSGAEPASKSKGNPKLRGALEPN